MTYSTPNRELKLIRAGLIDFNEAWQLQEKLFAEIVEIKLANRHKEVPLPVPNYLILCEHPPVFTLGKSGTSDNLLLDEQGLNEVGAGFYRINRGGDITHHGPGQLVVYPLLDLENFFTDIHLYLRTLEEIVIKTLADFGLSGGRYPGYTGVWLEPDGKNARKICAMGVKCGRWVTMHGLALNVANDLSYFNHIIPCGIKEKSVTSMAAELSWKAPTIETVSECLLTHFAATFNASIGQ